MAETAGHSRKGQQGKGKERGATGIRVKGILASQPPQKRIFNFKELNYFFVVLQ